MLSENGSGTAFALSVADPLTPDPGPVAPDATGVAQVRNDFAGASPAGLAL
jgi:hypothetical protein